MSIIFSRKKTEDKTIIRLLGIKISFKRKKRDKLKFGKSTRDFSAVYSPNNIILNYLYDKHFTNQDRRWFIEQKFIRLLGYFPNFDNPKTFNEKIHWMNLYNHNPLIPQCKDKYNLKKYITEKLGSEYVVPLIGAWDRVSDIDFDALPNQFVIKINWSDGEKCNFIVKDKASADIDYIKSQLADRIQPWHNAYYKNFAWGSKNIPPKIIAEEYIEQLDGKLNDYKLYCYNGKHKHTLVCKDRSVKTKYINMDKDWNCFMPSKNSTYEEKCQKPKMYDKMVAIAEKLSKPFPLCRVDFYEVDDKIYIGEMTFNPNCGYNHYKMEWDLKLGEWIDLSKIPSEYLKF